MVAVTPAGESRTAEPTQEVQSYTKRTVKNLAELKEKILIFDAGFDDVAIELVKNALCTIIAKTYQVNRVHAYFSRINEEEMEFAVFLPRKQSRCTILPSWMCTASPKRCCALWILWTRPALPGWIPVWPASCFRIIKTFKTVPQETAVCPGGLFPFQEDFRKMTRIPFSRKKIVIYLS